VPLEEITEHAKDYRAQKKSKIDEIKDKRREELYQIQKWGQDSKEMFRIQLNSDPTNKTKNQSE